MVSDGVICGRLSCTKMKKKKKKKSRGEKNEKNPNKTKTICFFFCSFLLTLEATLGYMPGSLR